MKSIKTYVKSFETLFLFIYVLLFAQGLKDKTDRSVKHTSNKHKWKDFWVSINCQEIN